jgi:hypothetical protein
MMASHAGVCGFSLILEWRLPEPKSDVHLQFFSPVIEGLARFL